MVAEWREILVSVGAIVLAVILALFIKSILYRYRRPNGRKGGIISLHATAAFAIATTVAIITRDWFLTALTAVLAYLVARGRLDEGQHYMYQVVLGAILGVAVPFGAFYLYNQKMNSSSPEREEYDDMPERAHDDRHEADIEAPELALEDLDEN